MNPICTLPATRKTFAKKVLNTLTEEQKEEFGINSTSLNDAIETLASLTKPWLENSENEDEQNEKLNHPETFIPRLEENAKIIVDDASFDRASQEFDEFEVGGYKQNLSRLVHLEADSREGIEVEKSTITNNFGTVIQLVSEWEDLDDGSYHATYIVKKPIKSTAMSTQEKALEALNKISKQSESTRAAGYFEIRNKKTGELKRWKGSVWNTPAPDGWEKTGRVFWTHNNKRILANSVSNEVHGFKDEAFVETWAYRLGKLVDELGRQFFDKESDLWKLGDIYDIQDSTKITDAQLEKYIKDNLQDIYTVQGFRNVISDFIKLEKEIEKRWPGAKAFSGKLKLFAKNVGQDDYITGEPDLIIVDGDGKLHILDFKTWKIGSGKDYQTLYEDPNASTDYKRREHYSEQVSYYIRILQANGFDVEETPYVVQVDTYYASQDLFELGTGKVGVKATKDKNSPAVALNNYIEEEGISSDNDARREVIQIINGNGTRKILYIEPRLHLGTDESSKKMSDELAALRGKESLEFDGNITFEKQFESLDKFLQEVFEDFAGPVMHRGLAQGISRYSEADIDSRPDLISQDEMMCIAEGIMYRVSDIINGLISGDEWIESDLQEAFPEIGTKLRGKTRKEVLKEIGIANLVRYVFDTHINGYDKDLPILTKEEYDAQANEDGEWENEEYGFSSWEEYSRKKNFSDRSAWLVNHYSQLIMKGQRKLRALEGVACPVKMEDGTLSKELPDLGDEIDSNDFDDDYGDNQALDDFIDKCSEGIAGISNLEAWMMGQKNYSPKASLAKEIRRMFEDIILVDEDGEEVIDRYGWQFPQHLDSTKAMQACLDICRNCETIEEMEEALKSAMLSSSNKWIQQVLDKISPDNEKLRTKFFRHMRKDAFLYSVAELKVVNGQRVIQTRIINMKSANQTMVQSLNASFVNGAVGSFKLNDGTGRTLQLIKRDGNGNNVITLAVKNGTKKSNAAEIIADEIDELKEIHNKTIQAYRRYSRIQKQNKEEAMDFADYVADSLKQDNFAKRLTNVLQGIGILVTEDVVENAMMRRLDQTVQGNLAQLLENSWQVCKKLREMSGEGGIPRGIAGNSAFAFYKPIIDILADYVQEHVEASSYQGGKTYYTYSNPSRLGHVIRNLKDALVQFDEYSDTDKPRQFLWDHFGRYQGWYTTNEDRPKYLCDWIKQFSDYRSKRGIRARAALQHKVELSFTGDQYKDLGPLGFMRSLLHNYFGSRTDEAEGNGMYRWFGMPTMSNKPTNEFVRMLKYEGEEEIIEKVLKPTFDQEMNRIVDVLWNYACNSTPIDQIDIVGIDGKDKLRKLIEEEVRSKNEKSIREELSKDSELKGTKLKKEIDARIKSLVDEEIKQLKGYNVTEENEKGEKVITHIPGRIENAELTLDDLKRLLRINSGAKFHFLWYLNDEILNDADSTLDDDTTIGERLVDRLNLLLSPKDSDAQINKDTNYESETDQAITNIIEQCMEDVVNDEFAKMEEIGLFDTEKVRIKGQEVEVLKYQKEFGGKLGSIKTEKIGTKFRTAQDAANDAMLEFREGIRDYIWQDIAANINIIQITGGDLAFFGNSVNYQKRIAMFHSPGIHLMHNEKYDDGYLRSVHISDDEIISDVKENALIALDRYKDSLDTEDQKREYEMMINIIASGFDGINTTDGQSYSSLTSMRKKLSMMGDWTDEDEDAYAKVLAGDLSMETLGAFINPKRPQKPMVAADMAKYSGSPTMAIRKVPLQDKNSEYLIILAEALARHSGKRSKLAAISDFMERTTHEDFDLNKPTHKHGIDTVHFMSVGKVGVSGVIDIKYFDNNYDRIYEKAVVDKSKEVIGDKGKVLSKDEAYNALLTSYLLDKVKVKESSKTDPSVADTYNKQQELKEKGALKEEELYYDSNYVDTIEVEDYIIQQEVPPHLLDDREQLYGSQIRILGISDITPGTKLRVWNAKEKKYETLGDRSTKEEKGLIEEYEELHAENINSSFDDLMKELGIDELVDARGQRININMAPQQVKDRIYTKMATLLQKQLLRDGKYNMDLEKACRLIRNASGVVGFAVPLMDPIQGKRVQMLLNSIIKERINKQGIAGGPVVQTTAYDNRLHIRFQDQEGNILQTLEEFREDHPELESKEEAAEAFKEYLKDKQAGIAYYECYMPIPNPALEKLITNPDGTIMSVEDIKKKLPKEVWKSLSEAIGYRIPTEDKYSMVPLKIMGFVPKAAGEVIMLPQEITYLTGSDFDIDKIYIMLKSFETSTLSITKDTDINYSKITIEKNGEKIVIDVNGFKGDIGKTAEEREAFLKAVSKLVSNADRILSGDYSRTLTSGMSNKEKSIITDQIVVAGKKQPNFLNWFRDQLLENAFTEYTDTEDAIESNARNARNNRILDLQWSVLTSADTVSKMLNPGNFEPQKKVGRMIRIIKEGLAEENTLEEWDKMYEMSSKQLDKKLSNSDPHSVTLPMSKIYFQRQNMQGTQMVGIFANNNVSHAFMTLQRVGIDLAKGNYDKSFYFDGVHIGDHNNPTVLDPQRGRNGQLISKVIASFLAASVDTAKDPTLADMNINTFTGGVAMALARMGFDTQEIGLFLSQPIIMELTNLYFRNRSSQVIYTGNNAIAELLANMGLTNEDMWNMKSVKHPGTLTKENFIKHLNDTDFLDKKDADKSSREFQIAVLSVFDSLLNISRDLQDLTFCTKFNSVTNAVGPTIADTEERKQKVTKFIRDLNKSVFYIPRDDKNRRSKEKGSMVTDYKGFTDPGEVISNDPILKAFYESTIGDNGASKIIFENFFLHYSKGFQNVLDFFRENYIKSGKIDSKLYNKLLDDYMYYCLTYKNEESNIRPVIPSDNDLRDEEEGDLDYLVLSTVKRFKDIQKLQEKRSIPNMLLDQHLGNNCLRIRESDDYITQDILEFNSSQLNADAQDEVGRAWDAILQMNDPKLTEEENMNIRRFGVDLFFYSIMRNGFGFSPKTLMHISTVIVRYSALFGSEKDFSSYIQGIISLPEISNILTGARLAGAGNNYGHLSRFCDQFVRNHSNNKSIVPFVERDNVIVEDRLSKGDVLVLSVRDDENYKLKPFMLNDKEPLKFVNLVTRTSDGMKYELYELDTKSNTMVEGSRFKTIKYKKTTRLGITNQFIEYNANDNIKESYYDKVRGTSDAGFDEEESEGTSNTSEGETVDYDEATEWDAVYAEIKRLNKGPLVGRGEGGDSAFRQKLKKACESEDENILTADFKILLDKDAAEADKVAAWERIKSVREQIDDIINPQEKC